MGERWSFNANKDDESSGGFSLLTPGRYLFGIEDKQDTVTQKGLPMATLTLKALEGPSEGQAFHRVVCIPQGEKGHGFLLHFLHAVEMPYDGDVDFDTDEFIGRQFWADVSVKPYTKKDGSAAESNSIDKVYTAEEIAELNGEAPAVEAAAEPEPEPVAAERPAVKAAPRAAAPVKTNGASKVAPKPVSRPKPSFTSKRR